MELFFTEKWIVVWCMTVVLAVKYRLWWSEGIFFQFLLGEASFF